VFFIMAWEIAGAFGLLGSDYSLPKAIMCVAFDFLIPR